MTETAAAAATGGSTRPAATRTPLSGDWLWVNTTMSDGTVITPEDSTRFGMRFLHNRRIDVFADCNRVVGRYHLAGEELNLRFGGYSKNFCGEGSQSQAFVDDIRRVTGVLLQGDDLYLTLEMDSGTMHFARQ
jgi:heat shock protein HslJ